MERDGITRDIALKRISSQIPDSSLENKCAYIIDNNSTAEALKEKVKHLKSLLFDQEI
jgi:dephospho-CoA kinase